MIRMSLFLLATFMLAGCSYIGLGPDRIPSGASYGVPGGGGADSPVVNTARSVIGTPYRWGGDSPNEGFDCSGLVYWAYARHGIRLPRPSWEQIGAGHSVPKSRLRAGDLVFFKLVRGRSYHVGIYTGRGTFVHSPKSGDRVRESSLAADYWNRHYVVGRRVAVPLRADR